MDDVIDSLLPGRLRSQVRNPGHREKATNIFLLGEEAKEQAQAGLGLYGIR